MSFIAVSGVVLWVVTEKLELHLPAHGEGPLGQQWSLYAQSTPSAYELHNPYNPPVASHFIISSIMLNPFPSTRVCNTSDISSPSPHHLTAVVAGLERLAISTLLEAPPQAHLRVCLTSVHLAAREVKMSCN